MRFGIISTLFPCLALAGKGTPPPGVTANNLTEGSLGVMSAPSFVLFASPDGTAPPIGQSDKEELENAVKSSYLDKFPSTLDPVWFSTGISATRKRTSDGYNEYDVQIPNLGTCHPRLSSVVPIAEGIFCSSTSTGCSYARQVTLSQTYSTTAGLKVGASVTVGGSWIVSVEMSITTEASWEETWSSGSSESNTYTFNLAPGGSCIPSMIHVELECDVAQGTYWHDTTMPSLAEAIITGLLLEFDKNRHESAAPYGREGVGSGLQYCRYQPMDIKVLEAPAYRPELWKSLINDADTSRGMAYIGNPADLNSFRVPDPNHPSLNKNFDEDELIFSRPGGIADVATQQPRFLRCKPARPKSKSGKMLVPMKGQGGIVQGYIGCI
ncbi:hypothetical protein ONS96_008359 [Cadophora gregata f. sp. sojae]|nr:hypothetical protein ONS96_008359 [Cadophora gregata f. sp. sojae]